jgi:23S rRNA (cytosine1962-C5)-methyltransferase
MSYPLVRLKPGRDRPLLTGHPWVFSGALQTIPPVIEPGEVVDLHAATGEFVARGYLHQRNSLAFRQLTANPDEAIDDVFFERRVADALTLRAPLDAQQTNAYRLIHAEGDFLPGLIVDRFDRWLVVQIHTAGMERQRDRVLAALRRVAEPSGILVRNDIGVRGREGLQVGKAEVAWGEVPDSVEVLEGGIKYVVDPHRGQKTGFFLDQRDKRANVRQLAPRAQTLLNLFSYSGGFALAGLAGNAALHTVNVDASRAALDLARQNYTLNGHNPESHEFVVEDAVAFLRARSDAGERFDLVVVDPPAYAKSAESKPRALYGYETLNTHAARIVSPGGYLLTCSCSGPVDMAEFESVVHGGLLHARRRAQVIQTFTVSLDHPTLPGFPEDRYLKAILLRLL